MPYTSTAFEHAFEQHPSGFIAKVSQIYQITSLTDEHLYLIGRITFNFGNLTPFVDINYYDCFIITAMCLAVLQKSALARGLLDCF